MIVNVDNEILENSVKTIAGIVGSNEEGLIFFRVVSPNMLRISSMYKGKGVAIYIPCNTESKSEFKKFAIEPKSFLSAIQGRKKIQIKIAESTVMVLSNKYKAELVTTAAESERIIPEDVKNGENVIKLSHELLEFIRQNLGAIELTPTLETYSFMPVAIRVTDKGTMMVCYDNWHMAYATSKKVTGKLQFSIPVSSLALLSKEFQGKSYKVHLTDSALYAYNDSFELALPLPQSDSQNVIPADEAFILAKSIRQQEGVKVLLASEDIKAISSNMEAVYKKGEHIDFDIQKTECKVMLKSTHGKVVSSARCKADKAISFRTGFSFLKDTMLKVGGKKLEIQVVPDKMLFFNNGNKTYMLALLTKGKTE